MNKNKLHPAEDNVPVHIGLIPDGGRRWAKLHKVRLIESYLISMQKLSSIVDELFSNSTKIVSIFGSSILNFNRSREEVDAFCRSQAEFLKHDIQPLIGKYELQISIAGNRQILPSYFSKIIQEIENGTILNKGKKVYLCSAYDPIQELAAAPIMSKRSYNSLLSHLWVKEPLDLIIRTGGANLLSNFLPMQSGFARLYFLDKLFNDIEMKDIHKILSKFNSITRKYGN